MKTQNKIFMDEGIDGRIYPVSSAATPRKKQECGAPVIATIKRRQKAKLIELGIHLAFVIVFGTIAWFIFHHFMAKAMAPLKSIQQQHQPQP